MEFRILGPLEVQGKDGPVALGGIKPRAVVAALLLHANESVHPERLALEVWGEETPASAVKTVQVYVSRLRKAFDDPDVLATTTAGYCLRVLADELDAARFERLVEDGRAALAAGRAEHAAAVLREALALWRGPPLADLEFEPFAQTEIARLQEQRLSAIEERVEADLALGRHRALVAELRQLVADNSRRERLVGQLMLALYRDGRQDEALELFRATRRVLLDEIGVEPGPQLRELNDRILRQDVALHPAAPPAPQLPSELDASIAPPLVGRDGELAWLRLRWDRARERSPAVVAIVGQRGAGKTRLAAELAGAVHGRGDTVLYVSGEDPAGGGAAALRALRDPARPTLLVVDDCDRAGDEFVAQLEEATRELRESPVLVAVCGEDASAVERLRVDGVLTLERLGAVAVGAIARQYISRRTSEEVPSEWLLEASGGIPRRVHDVASQWARREAGRRVGAGAAKVEAERSQLRSIHDELTGDLADFQYARQRIVQQPSEPVAVVCPFKGLASYEVTDAKYFFGRERLVRELVARLVGAPLLGIVGPSGSGKSSVLRAGLLPELGSGALPESEKWAQRLMRPGEHPLQTLAKTLDQVDGERHLLLAIDQFEEIFTACDDEEERERFVAEIVRAAQDPEGRHVIVVALRADFYGRCATYPGLSELLATNNVLVGSMRRDELRTAIEGPAHCAGLRVETELVDALVSDLKGARGDLPLLSTALLELWQRRDGRTLRHAAYERTGGVRGAVARLAEDAYGDLDETQQSIARGVLMRMVGENEGETIERRRVALAELETQRDVNVGRVVALLTDRRLLTISSGAVELAHEALMREWPRFAAWLEEDRAGLRIQRALAAAAQGWQELKRDEGSLYRGARLIQALEWSSARPQALNELEREFLKASQAARDRERVARRRRRRLAAAALAAVTAILVASGLTIVFANRERDMTASRDLATKSSTLLATDPGLALAIALEALQRRDTEEAKNAVRQATFEHRARRIVRAHDGLIFDFSFSLDGRQIATASDDRTVRIWSADTGRRVGEIRGHRGDVKAVAFSPSGDRVASAAKDGEIVLAAPTGGRRHVIARLPAGDYARTVDFAAGGDTLAIGTDGGRVALVRTRDGAVRDFDASPDLEAPVYAVDLDEKERNLVSAGADGVVRIWPLDGKAPVEIGGGAPILAARFSPDGTRVATAGADGALRVYAASDGRKVMDRTIPDQILVSLSFSGDGRRVAVASLDGAIRLFGLRERAELAKLRGHKSYPHVAFSTRTGVLASVSEEDETLRIWSLPANEVALRPGRVPRFSDDGRLVVSGDDDGPVHLWDTKTGKEIDFAGQTEVSYPQFSPGARWIVSASHDDTVRLWDLRTRESRRVPVPPKSGSMFGAAIDRSGRRIAFGGATPIVVIQAPDGGHRLRLKGHKGNVNALVFSPDANHLLTGGDDGTARIWDARTGKLKRTLRRHEGIVRGVAYSADGQLMATTGSDGAIRVWPADGGGDPVVLLGHEGGVNSAAFDGAGDRLVSAGDDGTVRVWDAGGGDALVVLHRHEGVASGADFDPAGRRVVSAGVDGMRITSCEGVCGSFAAALRVAHTRAQHKLSAAERQRLLPDS